MGHISSECPSKETVKKEPEEPKNKDAKKPLRSNRVSISDDHDDTIVKALSFLYCSTVEPKSPYSQLNWSLRQPKQDEGSGEGLCGYFGCKGTS